MWALWRRLSPKSALAKPAMMRKLAGSQPVILQHVRMRRSRISTREVAFGGIVFFVAATVYIHVVVDPWDRFIRAHLAGMSKEELLELKKKMDEPSFYPIPLTLHTVDSLPYRGSDPEWTMFIKVNKDGQLCTKLRKDLAAKVLDAVAQSPAFAKQGPWKMKHWWLYMDYPKTPPPVYYRKGILSTNEGYSWAKKEVDRVLAVRLQRAFYPEPVALGFWSLTTSLAKQNAMAFAARFGYRPEGTGSPIPKQPQSTDVKGIADKAPQTSPKHAETVKKEAGAMATAGQKTAGAPPAGASSTTSTPSSGDSTGSGKFPTGSAQGSLTGKDGKEITARDLVPFDTIRTHLDGPIKKGLAEHRRKWRSARCLPPRGSISFSGLVEVKCSTGTVLIEVQAWYDPKEKQFDPHSMMMGIRRTDAYTQHPLRK